ncbi:MAG: hypothetical protein Q8O66_03690 [bacterium]|nr:hypothetical protein [bacterium]
MRLAAVIASNTRNKTDINSAIDRAVNHGNANLRAGALAIVAKTLAEAGHFSEARRVVSEMAGMDAYWRAEARIWIARFSGEANDIEDAETAVSNIHTSHIRNELRIDMENLVHNRPHHTGAHAYKHHSDLSSLQAVLSELRGMEDSHGVTPKHNSAFLRLKAQEIINRLFADAMK